MNNENQLKLALIERNTENDMPVQQRLMDGYINATELCQASGKNFNDYSRLKSTNEFINELSSETGIPASALIQSVRGGDVRFQGTWVHPQVAINLAQWASPKFAVLVSKWVFEWMSGNISGGKNLPYHLQRYMINRTQIPHTHFSIFNELVYNLIAPLEDHGYELPDSMVPDISEGRMFADWVRRVKKLNPDDFPKYNHTYPDGRSFPARLYPNELLAEFREHFHNVWLVKNATRYFVQRDANALPYLRKMIDSLPEGKKEEALEEYDKASNKLRLN
jgi:hypothetical protein